MQQSLLDGLTGLLNHRSFQEDLRKMRSRHTDFYVIMCDIDYFKQINDRYGHIIGDVVLRQIAGILKEPLSSSNKGSVYRYGGEEFAILLPSFTLREVQAYLDRIKEQLSLTPFESEDTTFQVTLSFGVATPHGDEDALELLKRADELLYVAKENGRDQYVFEAS